MKKNSFCYSILFFTSLTFAVAQKLPGKQAVSIIIPATLTIDGVPDEWPNGYAAFNRSTEIYYTIANDNDNLYLTVHANNSKIIEKIMEGGISFTVSSNGKINEKKDLTVLFPLLKISDCRNILRAAGKTLSEGSNIAALNNIDPTLTDKTISMAKANALLVGNLKEIKVSNTNIADTITGVTPKSPYYCSLPLRFHDFKLIHLSNHDGIKAMTKFANDGTFTYELLIPLQLAKIHITDLQKLKYKITLNARGEDARIGNTWWYTHTRPQEKMYLDLETPTDFEGEYILAKKP